MKVEIFINGLSKRAMITPDGFWTDIINVDKHIKLGRDDWEPTEIRWSSGGADGTLSNRETVKSFVRGLERALEIQEEWDK